MHRRILLWKTADTDGTRRVTDTLRALAESSTWEAWNVGPHVGASERSYDGALVIDFASSEELESFLASSAHLDAVGAIRPLITDIAAVNIDLETTLINAAAQAPGR